jgi:uncharacterized membrane protein HdeD (DUF308 family)
MNLSRLITGIFLGVGGLVLIFIPVFFSYKSYWIYGIIVFLIGIFILFNKKEDKIEGIKSRGGKK